MKVLILATDIYTRGGIARYTWSLASALGDMIGLDSVHVLPLLDMGGSKGLARNFRILDVAADRPTPAAKLRFAMRALQKAHHGYSLTICSHVALAPIAAAIRYLYGTPFWVACHDAEVWNPIPPPKLGGLRRAQLALPVSNFTAEKLHEVNGVPREKIRVLHNAVPDEFAALLMSEKDRLDAITGLAKEERYILSVGSLAKAHSYKGFDLVIRALPQLLAEVPELRYVIVGTGDDRPRLEGLAYQTGVRGQVVFAGPVDDEQLADYYRGCDVFVLPSRTSKQDGRWHGEGFGRVYAEAALAGRPVVGSRGGGAAEAVVHGKTGLLVDPTNLSEVSDALLTLLQSADLAAAMGREGRSWVSRTFRQSALRSQLAQMLGTVVHREVRC